MKPYMRIIMLALGSILVVDGLGKRLCHQQSLHCNLGELVR